ncbi:cytochrome P450 [Aspergillus steynii IBT 23096]|uniref:Cytochrome P450 n=1 Tax=Aspergillus steynii IBT 23096 TaxID=1392250 RepID=A0A2I2FY43_9EURO|nr:cytochrome P450 [Aspergillus steynii IBT 23096]PLB45551.1 cytochrome P450 [Aspergillus steynii IBT 23096]
MSDLRQVCVFFFILSIPFLLGYLVNWGVYHWINLRRRTATPGKQVPPDLPVIFPVLGHTVQFLFDGTAFVKNATTYWGQLTCVRISLLFNGIYLFQEPEAVAAIWRHPFLSSPIFIYTVGLRYLFGMKEKAIETYAADDSGPYRRPHWKSNVAPHNRVDFLTHESLMHGLSGPGLAPTFQRFQAVLGREVERLPIQNQWVEMPDLLQFFRNHVGRAVLTSLFGSALPDTNPTFMDNLWKFDAATPWLAKRVSRLIYPEGYRVRDQLLGQIQSWYRYAREHFDQSLLFADGDGDPFWGSGMMRERQKFILKIDNQDDASLASTDLGLILSDTVCRTSTSDFSVSMEKLLRKDLLQSVYAETLRLYVQSYVTRCSPHEPVEVANWYLPQNEVSMVSSYVAHMNDAIWNTHNGAHPATRFWADRFLIDANDASSGPLRPDPENTKRDSKGKSPCEPRFSLQGLEGSWIPYGGGFGACPGRLLAKRIILFTCALFVTQFEIDVKTRDFTMDSSGFGLGTQKPKEKIVFAIRRRESKT